MHGVRAFHGVSHGAYVAGIEAAVRHVCAADTAKTVAHALYGVDSESDSEPDSNGEELFWRIWPDSADNSSSSSEPDSEPDSSDSESDSESGPESDSDSSDGGGELARRKRRLR